MKLKRLKLNQNYKSLQEGFEIVFEPNLDSTTIDPVCFVGPNGSGKSNVLEAIADIFYFIESYVLGYTEHAKYKVPIQDFEIEYFIPRSISGLLMTFEETLLNENYAHILISKVAGNNPEFSIISADDVRQINDTDAVHLLPHRIWGYSSGENEIISIPFLKMDLFYFKEKEDNLKAGVTEIIKDNRLHYVDYDTCATLILSNFIMFNRRLDEDAYAEKLDVFEEQFGIEEVLSFKFTIRDHYRQKSRMPLEPQVNTLIQKLKDNLGSRNIKTDHRASSFTFSIDLTNTEHLDIFKSLASGASGLYAYFEKLKLHNKHAIPERRRNKVLYGNDPYYVHNNVIDPTADEKPFIIDEIMLKMKGIDEPISYKTISDGEHQALTIFSLINLIDQDGVLCLLDEPETHLNPKWKYDFINLINKIQKQYKSQILITTHDPIFISGLRKEDVILFHKKRDLPEGVPRWKFADQDLRGLGVDAILTSDIFNLNTTLDENTYSKFIQRRILLVKKERNELNPEEIILLEQLNEELIDIDFNKPFDDPLYKDFIMALDNLEDYKKKNITEEDRKERENISKEIMERLNNEGF
ncbi:AAA family ATPase [Lacinutrix sp. MEBiC02595]